MLATMLVAAALASACGGAGAAPRRVAEIDTVGDTVIVRTVAGGEWGSPASLETDLQIGGAEAGDAYQLGNIRGLAVGPDGAIYAFDAQGPVLRKYAPDGRFVRNFGRPGGGGPGEYRNSDGGLAVLADGRVVLRDQGNARFQLWHPDGRPAGQWSYPGGVLTSTPMFVDTAGHVYSPILHEESWTTALVRYAPDGTPLDTIRVPDPDYEPPMLVARRIENGVTRGTMTNPVPFSPGEHWTFSPLGYFVAGVATRYALDLLRPEGVLRIERAVEPVAITAAEKGNAEEVATDNMRGMVADWTWNGPPVPDAKPPYTGLFTARDGRIWVQVSQPGERIPEDELEEPLPRADGRPRPVRTWREPVAFDVFAPDGAFLGRVHTPRGFQTSPPPVIRGDTLWAVVRDEHGAQTISRLLIRLSISPARAVTGS